MVSGGSSRLKAPATAGCEASRRRPLGVAVGGKPPPKISGFFWPDVLGCVFFASVTHVFCDGG